MGEVGKSRKLKFGKLKWDPPAAEEDRRWKIEDGSGEKLKVESRK